MRSPPIPNTSTMDGTLGSIPITSHPKNGADITTPAMARMRCNRQIQILRPDAWGTITVFGEKSVCVLVGLLGT